jgi:hypothetical protein
MKILSSKFKRLATNSWFWASIVFVFWITNQSNAFNAAVFIFIVNGFLTLTKGLNVPEIDSLELHPAAQISEATIDPLVMHSGFEGSDACEPGVLDPFDEPVGSELFVGPADKQMQFDSSSPN